MAMGATEWPADRPERRAIATLRPFPRNARTHSDAQIDQVAASIREWGWTMAVLIDETGEIIAGHARVLAAQRLGLEEIPVVVARGWSDEQKRAYVITDNKLPLNAGWDDGLLKLEITDLRALGFDVTLTGFAPGELQSIYGDGATSITGRTDPDAVPPEPARPVTKRNDVWLLGPHRLMCGDCREADDMAKLMAGRAVNLAFTSPPYAEQRAYDAASGFTKIAPDAYVEWFTSVAANIAANLAHDGSWFVNIKPCSDFLDTSLYVHDLVGAHVRRWGWHWVTEFCWQRPGVPKRVDRRFKNQFEPIYQFVRNDFKMRANEVRTPSQNVPKARGKGAGNTSWAEHQGRGIARGNMSLLQGNAPRVPGGAINAAQKQGTPGFEWFGDHVGAGLAYPGNLLPTFTGTHTATGHAAAFPVGLPEWFIHAYSDKGDVVLDPFMGSGSTLIAAHGTGRHGRGMELSPIYCDVALVRWQDFTGSQAILEADARTFAEVAAERLDGKARSQADADGVADGARQSGQAPAAGRRARRAG